MATPTTLPAAFTAGQVLTAAQMNNLRGAFRILQVVSSTATTQVQNNTNVYADTGLSVAITPQSTSSKILIMGAHNGLAKTSTNGNCAVTTQLLRGATSISVITKSAQYTGTAIFNVGSETFFYLDSPATTSATTYKTQIASLNNNDGAVININVGGGTAISYIVAMEISA
jgi:hypothetical protein